MPLASQIPRLMMPQQNMDLFLLCCFFPLQVLYCFNKDFLREPWPAIIRLSDKICNPEQAIATSPEPASPRPASPEPAIVKYRLNRYVIDWLTPARCSNAIVPCQFVGQLMYIICESIIFISVSAHQGASRK